ncbi:MAG: copper oxidase [Desulfobacterales bacterium]|nr:MAG: copper oxidase [Desulfobacterales bacterium]
MRYLFTNVHGGVSDGPYTSLNIAFSVGDDPVHVGQNREIVKQKIRTSVLVSSRQIHKDKIAVIRDKPDSDLKLDGYDALITNCAGVALMVQSADCQGVLLHDPHKKVIAAIHSGWRGSVADIISKTVSKMRQLFNSNPADINAYISPSLGPCCAEFVHYRATFPAYFKKFQVRPAYFDFWALSNHQLLKTGLQEKHIRISGVCTCCNSDYFSYRRASRSGDTTTGRQAAIICL